ncbi:sulfate adenylyltransferase subunit CysN [Spongorhabdus nitratireducens]
MSHQSELIEKDIEAYLYQHEQKDLLRLLTCGSVDDGKSTLIGRLLHDSKMIYEDQLAAVTNDSRKSGTQGDNVDLALLVDGLQAEREQGITIDVAYRYFSTEQRKFIIADTPGHEQYTRNMATGASTCDLAVILIDARHGLMTQTRRHTFIASLLGIRHILVAVNKMDLVAFSKDRFEEIRNDYLDFAEKLSLGDVKFVPISALDGDNVVSPSENTPWYEGPTLMNILETVQISSDRNLADFRLPVQYVNRPNLNFRGFAGTIASGEVKPGDEVMVLPSRKTSRVDSIVTYDGNLDIAAAGQAVTLTLEDEIDISRGDMLVHPHNPPQLSRDLNAKLVWMAEEAMKPGKQYTIKAGSLMASGTVSAIQYRIDVNTLEQTEADQLQLNEIAQCSLSLDRPLPFDAYKNNRATGAFIVIDRLTNATVAAGMLQDAETEDTAVLPVTQAERKARLGHSGAIISITGNLAEERSLKLERQLFNRGGLSVVIKPDEIDQAYTLKNAGLLVVVSGDVKADYVFASDGALALEDLLSAVFD